MTLNDTDFEHAMRTLGFADVDQLGMLNQEIIRQLKIARRVQGSQIAKKLKMHDRVQLPANSKPKYLANQTGKVVDIKESRAHVLLDRGPQGKFRNGIVVCSFSMLELI